MAKYRFAENGGADGLLHLFWFPNTGYGFHPRLAPLIRDPHELPRMMIHPPRWPLVHFSLLTRRAGIFEHIDQLSSQTSSPEEGQNASHQFIRGSVGRSAIICIEPANHRFFFRSWLQNSLHFWALRKPPKLTTISSILGFRLAANTPSSRSLRGPVSFPVRRFCFPFEGCPRGAD